MDQLMIAEMIPRDTDPVMRVPVKLPKLDYVVPGLLATVLVLTVAPLVLPRAFRSTCWVCAISAAIFCYHEADKRQKDRAYYEAARDASYDLFANRLARSVEEDFQN